MSSSGVVKSFSDEKGWGFLKCDGIDTDVFLHVKECQDGRPNAGDQVIFDLVEDGKRQGMQAINVTGCTGSVERAKGKGKGKGNRDPSKTSAMVKSFDDVKGWGFIDHNGVDVFVHVKECLDGRPAAGDWLSFDLADDLKRPGQLQAKNVTGCSNQGGGKGGMGGGMAPMVPGGMAPGGCGKGHGKMMAGQIIQVVDDGYGGCYGIVPLGDSYGGGFAKGGCPKGGYGKAPPSSRPKGKAKGGGRGRTGQVKNFNDAKGWGFIDFQGSDVFLHVKDCDGRPQIGDVVTFDTEADGARGGQLKALNVTGCTGAGEVKPGRGLGMGGGAVAPQYYGAAPYPTGRPLGRKGGGCW